MQYDVQRLLKFQRIMCEGCRKTVKRIGVNPFLEMVLDGLIIFLALLGGRNRRVLAHERFVPLPEWRGRGQIWRPAQVGLFAGATPKPRTVCSQLYRSRSLQVLERILLCHHVLRSTRFTNVCTTEN